MEKFTREHDFQVLEFSYNNHNCLELCDPCHVPAICRIELQQLNLYH